MNIFIDCKVGSSIVVKLAGNKSNGSAGEKEHQVQWKFVNPWYIPVSVNRLSPLTSCSYGSLFSRIIFDVQLARHSGLFELDHVRSSPLSDYLAIRFFFNR